MEVQTRNPWLHIWVYPKETMRAVLNTNPNRSIIWLAIIWGMTLSLASFFWPTYTSQSEKRTIAIFIFYLISGGIFGLIYLYIGAWLYKFTGFWLGGKGTFIEVKSALGWNFYPAILANLASFATVLVNPNLWLQGFFGLSGIVISIWVFILFMNLLAEAHRFSAWKAFLTFIITCVLIFVAIMLVALLVPLLAPLF